jgi:hypothetical protein
MSFSDHTNVVKLSEGVSGFRHMAMRCLIVTNPPDPGVLSGFYLVLGTNQWALPADHNLWSNYVFSCDFKEQQRLPCSFELQIKDTAGNWIQFTTAYTPGSDGWDHVSASLAEFTPPPGVPHRSNRSLCRKYPHAEDQRDLRRTLRQYSIHGSARFFDDLKIVSGEASPSRPGPAMATRISTQRH